MNDWERLSRQAEHYKKAYPPGTRVLLQHMGNDPRPIDDNTRGTVDLVDDLGDLHCTFDNGRRLGLIPGEDSFRKLTQAELEQEQQAKENDTLTSRIQSAQTRSAAGTVSTHIQKEEPEH